MPDIERTMPFALEAEQSVLGAIMLNPEKINTVAEFLTENDFYVPEHRDIFAAMQSVRDKQGSIDPVTVSRALEQMGTKESSGGLPYLTELVATTPTSSNLKDYIAIVIEGSTRRKLISVCNEIGYQAKTGAVEAAKLLDDAERRIFKISVRKASDENMEAISTVYGRVYSRIGELMRLKGQSTGLSTGLIDLDELTSGLQKSDLIIIAGRPASGKSSLALNIATHAALRENATVAYFNLEMSKEQLAARLMSTETGVPLQSIRTIVPLPKNYPDMEKVIREEI